MRRPLRTAATTWALRRITQRLVSGGGLENAYRAIRDAIVDGTLARVAQVQRSNGGKVRIVAHSAQDAAGSSPEVLARDNFEVSRQRAIAVANQLMRLGVPANRIAAEAASDEEPAYETNTARGIAANRRAEIFVEF